MRPHRSEPEQPYPSVSKRRKKKHIVHQDTGPVPLKNRRGNTRADPLTARGVREIVDGEAERGTAVESMPRFVSNQPVDLVKGKVWL